MTDLDIPIQQQPGEDTQAWLARVWAQLVELNVLKDEMERKGLIAAEPESLDVWPPRFHVQ